MGLSSCKHDHARDRRVADCRPDRREASASDRARSARRLAGLVVTALLALYTFAASAQSLRLATYQVELSRRGPGLLLRDILGGDDPQVDAVIEVIASAAPDIILLTDLDHDVELRAVQQLQRRLKAAGHPMPHAYAPPQNAGLDSGTDLDGDGRLHGPADAQGYGYFTGDGAMALLSRYPIDSAGAQDFSTLLWHTLPGASFPLEGLPPRARAVQRLSHTGHWWVPVEAAGARISVGAFHATAPVFDGPEDRNGQRNRDEVLFWQKFLDGAFGEPPAARFAILGTANLDPVDGEGHHAAIATLLTHPQLQDPGQRRSGVPPEQSSGHHGDPAQDTANWPEPDPGDLRVDYALVSSDLTIIADGIVWPEPGTAAARASRHALVWVDVLWPPR